MKTLDELNELHRSGQLDIAKEGYLEYLERHPQDAQAHHALGMICIEEKKLAEGADYFSNAIKFQPNNPTLQLHLANVLKTQGQYSLATDILNQLLIQHPDFAPGYNNLGIMHYAQGHYTEAIKCYKLALEKNHDYVDAYYNLGLAYTKNNDLDDAAISYKNLLALAPEHFAARFQLACILMQLEKWVDGLSYFLAIEAEHPHHLETQINLATCYLKQGDLDNAKLHYLMASELNPLDTQMLFNLGHISMQQGYIDDAIRHYLCLLDVSPDDFSAHNNLGAIYIIKNDIESALHFYQAALRIQPHNTAIEHIVKILKKDKNLSISPSEYVKSLFNYYADHYDAHLLNVLNYQVPQILYNALAKEHLLKEQLDILDLGCGTGLCGVAFKTHAARLIGVDLSDKMLEIAAEKHVYDELVNEDFIAYLSRQQQTYDLITAGDVLVYIGDLIAVFKYASQALRPQGLLIFNTEISEELDYTIQKSGRFAHAKGYIERLAREAGLGIVYYEVCVTRSQENMPVFGHVVVVRKGG